MTEHRVITVLYAAVTVSAVAFTLLGYSTTLQLSAATPLLVGAIGAAKTWRRWPEGAWLIVGLGLSFAGDHTDQFIWKAAWFAGVHVAYILAFRQYSNNRYGVVIAGGAATVTVAYMSGTLWPLIIGYGLLITIMAWLASGLSRLAMVGGVVFMASDLLIALQYVRPSITTNWLSAVALGLYLIAQAALVGATIRANQEEA